MGTPAFLLALAAGAAFLALWVSNRFPERSPGGLGRALIHFGLALTLVWATPSTIGPLSALGRLPALIGVFLLVLPALVYGFLAATWILRRVHEAITD